VIAPLDKSVFLKHLTKAQQAAGPRAAICLPQSDGAEMAGDGKSLAWAIRQKHAAVVAKSQMRADLTSPLVVAVKSGFSAQVSGEDHSMSSGSAEFLYKRAEIEGNALGDEIVFFDDRVGKYFATGSVGADIWKLLEAPMSLDAIVARLLEMYEVEESVCLAETKGFLDHMVTASLIERA